MFMGIGGTVIAGFTQQAKKAVDEQRYERNKRVLQEAKQALLQYAYDYPQFNVQGPGRLPCPDTDDDGTAGSFIVGPPFVNLAICTSVGRFPWNHPNLNFYDARDTSNERLWYAVSNRFYNLGGGPPAGVNSDTPGTITIVDRSGALLYDGAVAGIAAVIIAPGPATTRDENNDGVYEYVQVRPLPAGIPANDLELNDPRNYLEIFNGFDNRLFNNGESNTNDDGFILGPVRESDPLSPAFNSIVVNDQMVIITADEVIAMAEKATLQAYRDALDEYQVNIGANRYPWLDPYDSADGLGTFDAVITPAAPDPVIGRLPSIFANYFDPSVQNPASQAIDPELRLSINIDLVIYNLDIPAPGVTNTLFFANGDLLSPLTNGPIRRFFWDGYKSGINGPPHPLSPADGIWEVCPLIDQVTFIAQEDDCNRTTAGTFEGAATDGISDVWLEVRDVTITLATGNPIVFADTDRTAAPIEYWVGGSEENPDPQNHVYIAAEYDENPAYISSFNWVEDEEFLNSFGENPVGNNGTHAYDAAGDTIKVGLPYYPVLPAWALSNGWHDSIQVAYSSAVQPGGDGVCTPGTVGNFGPPASDNCLTLLSSSGVTNDKLALFVISGTDINGDVDTGIVDGLDDLANLPDGDGLGVGGGVAPFFSDDLADIFEGENNTAPVVSTPPLYPELPANLTFDKRPNNGNDFVYLLE